MIRLLLIAVLFCVSCGPREVRLAPGEIPPAPYLSAQDENYGHEVLNQISQQYPIDYNSPELDRVTSIVDRITRAAHADKDPWHVYILKGDDFKNAAATRGNHVFVWTGILRVVQSDSELATILAHEIGHVLAGHTASDPSEEVGTILSGTAGQIVSQVMQSQGGAYALAADIAGEIVNQAIRVFAVNPDLQRKELEADQIGLFLMADAGYHPRDAVDFWARVKDDPDFSNGALAFLSTHPSSEDRLQRLELLLPEAESRYQPRKMSRPKSPLRKPRNFR